MLSLGMVISGPLKTDGCGLVSAGLAMQILKTYLIHIIPNEDVLCALLPVPLALIVIKPEKPLPPLAASRIEVVNPRAAAAPAPPIEFSLTTWRCDEETFFACRLVYRVALAPLEMRIDDHNHLPGVNTHFTVSGKSLPYDQRQRRR